MPENKLTQCAKERGILAAPTKQNLQDVKGNFAQVPNEMLDYFANNNVDLTPNEYRICFALIRELVGWDYAFKPIERATFTEKTKIRENHVSDILKSLIKKGVVLKRKVPGYRTPCYGFNADIIGRVTINPPKTIYRDRHNKIVDLKEFKVQKQGSLKYEPRDFESTNPGTFNSPKPASINETQVPKYSYIHLNTLKKDFSKEKEGKECPHKYIHESASGIKCNACKTILSA